MIFINNILTTKIYRKFPDKYVLITASINDDFNINNININDIILYRHTSKTYNCLGKVISVKNNKIIIQRSNITDNLGNHSKSKIIKLLEEI